MDDKLQKKLKDFIEKAKKSKVINEPKKGDLHSYNSLSENMKTKEQADLFKKLIKTL